MFEKSSEKKYKNNFIKFFFCRKNLKILNCYATRENLSSALTSKVSFLGIYPIF